MTITFGNEYWGKVWLNEMGVSFRLLLDQQRESYCAFGLERSFWGSWGPKVLWYYTKAYFQGRTGHDTGMDTKQLGGDFIVDKHGVVRWMYRSLDSTDRPSVETVFSKLRAIQ